MSKLIQLTIEDFTRLLGSDAPAPGGGSASALMGSVGAALTSMVAVLTLGREKYREHEALAKETAAASEELRLRFLDLLDLDTQAFNEMSAAFKMPKTTEEEKAVRRECIEKATKQATIVPFRMMESALECLKTTAGAVNRTNASAASDLGVAALSLRAAVHGAWLNVLINLGGIQDSAFAAQYKEQGRKILTECDQLADSIYAQIVEKL